MISLELAESLHRHGLRWTPARGDRFMLPGKDMDDDVFVLSDMTVEVHEYPTGQVIGFNGTTEWALDSIEQTEALWLPREDQLRSALGGLFARLSHDQGRYTVTVSLPSGERDFSASDCEQAYAAALLAVLQDVTSTAQAS